jgi:peptidoglycan/xylan/chitin deacetylase (PgdA/CDA1 family)
MQKLSIRSITPCLLLLTLIIACGNSLTPMVSLSPMGTLTSTTTLTPLPSLTATITPHPDTAPVFTPIAVRFVTHGDREMPYVALTFDLCQLPDHPSGFVPEIVDTLVQYNLPATFFLGGDWMRTHPEETKLLAANPLFELGNHSWSHPDLREIGWRAMDEEIVKTQDMLYHLTGREAHLFRLPYGYYNDEVLSVIAGHGLTTIQWDTESGDPDPTFNAATIQWAVREGVQNGSIIIMHANGNGWHTAEALPGVIDYLLDQGYSLVTISQLIGLEPIKIP